jgi:hypothetical protein
MELLGGDDDLLNLLYDIKVKGNMVELISVQ